MTDMAETSESQEIMARLEARLERALEPAFAECFSDETRKNRNFLLGTSSALFLCLLGRVHATGNTIELPIVGIKTSINAGLETILLALSVYFLVMFIARSSVEWRIWRLRQEKPFIGLVETIGEAAAEAKQRFNTIFALSLQNSELTKKLFDLAMPPSEVLGSPATLRRLHLLSLQQSEEIMRLLASPVPIDPAEADTRRKQIDGARLKHSATCEELDSFCRELDNLRITHEERTRAEREKLTSEQQLIREKLDSLRDSGSEIRVERMEDAGHSIRSIYWALTVRRWIEFVFPAVFGGAAVAWSISAAVLASFFGAHP